MLIHNRIENSSANGPGNRAVIWTQGCNLRCPRCWNQETHKFDPNKNITPAILLNWLFGIPDIEGVTFSGGEPFQHAGALVALCSAIKIRRPGFSIGAYTGYTLDELRNGTWWWMPRAGQWLPGTQHLAITILDTMDFVVAGRYNHKLRCEDKPLCGSRNQQVHFLTNRYSPADLKPNAVEMILDADSGLLQITGFPSNADQLTAE